MQKAEKLGIKAVFVTVDAAGRGKRESDERVKVDDGLVVNPVTGEALKQDKTGAGLTRLMGRYIDQGMTWKDIAWIRSVTSLPVILKGIGCAADAKLALEHGVDGIMVSNHGGRNLDFSPPSILILLEMHRLCPEVFDKMDVFIDGGFRRGGDILKAICLGAKAVGIGRSFLYSLHYGTPGAEHLVGCKFPFIYPDDHHHNRGLTGVCSAQGGDGKCNETHRHQEPLRGESQPGQHLGCRSSGSIEPGTPVREVQAASTAVGRLTAGLLITCTRLEMIPKVLVLPVRLVHLFDPLRRRNISLR